MGNKANVCIGLIAALATAFALNPDEESFKKYIDTKMQSNGSSWFERKLVSNITSLVYKREDYKFFSVVNVPENETNYLGIFGLWIPLPTVSRLAELKDDVEKDIKDASKDLKKKAKEIKKDVKKKGEELKEDVKKRSEEIKDELKSQ
jgi:gas vesicle protein